MVGNKYRHNCVSLYKSEIWISDWIPKSIWVKFCALENKIFYLISYKDEKCRWRAEKIRFNETNF